MLNYIVRRLFYMIVLLLMLSIVTFIIIQLPPGDYLTTYIQALEDTGLIAGREEIQQLEETYGLNLPVYQQYLKWIWNFLHGDMGRSFEYGRPVAELIGDRLALSVGISLLSLILTYVIAIPIGIYSATHQYSIADYSFTFFGFIGLATPNFLLALILMYVLFQHLGWSVGGLFSTEYQLAPWSFAKIVDLAKHLPVPLIVIGTAGTAGIIRVMRATLLDELSKQYVVTARAKGLNERTLLFKYPVRLAINPMVSSVGGLLPTIIAGETLTSIVVNLPTIGPLLLTAIQGQDMYLAGSSVMLLSALGIVGTLASDMLLVVSDPRIRFERQVAK